MKSKNPSPAIYRDREMNDEMHVPACGASWRRLGVADDRAERFEVILRLMLIVCVGTAMLTCGATTGGSTRLVDRAGQGAPVVDSTRVAVQSTASLLPSAAVRGTRKL